MTQVIIRSSVSAALLLIFAVHVQGCALIAITGAVAVTTVKVGAAAVGTAVDVTRAGVGVVTSAH